MSKRMLHIFDKFGYSGVAAKLAELESEKPELDNQIFESWLRKYVQENTLGEYAMGLEFEDSLKYVRSSIVCSLTDNPLYKYHMMEVDEEGNIKKDATSRREGVG